MHSHTYSGNPLGCSAALAVQKVLKEDNVLEKAAIRGKYLHQKLWENLMDHPNVGEIRNIGLINAIELVTDKKEKIGFDPRLRIGYQIYKSALQEGLLLRPLGNVLYFNPPLIINEDEIDKAVERCMAAIRKIPVPFDSSLSHTIFPAWGREIRQGLPRPLLPASCNSSQ